VTPLSHFYDLNQGLWITRRVTLPDRLGELLASRSSASLQCTQMSPLVPTGGIGTCSFRLLLMIAVLTTTGFFGVAGVRLKWGYRSNVPMMGQVRFS